MSTENFNHKNPFDWLKVIKVLVEWIIAIIKSLKTSLFHINSNRK